MQPRIQPVVTAAGCPRSSFVFILARRSIYIRHCNSLTLEKVISLRHCFRAKQIFSPEFQDEKNPYQLQLMHTDNVRIFDCETFRKNFVIQFCGVRRDSRLLEIERYVCRNFLAFLAETHSEQGVTRYIKTEKPEPLLSSATSSGGIVVAVNCCRAGACALYTLSTA